jgi:hypothetical protein
VLGVVLLTAAGLKTWQHYDPVPPALFGSTSLPVLQVQFETFLGIWLLLGSLPCVLRIVSVSTFALFACVSALTLLSGARSCGCFGSIAIPPELSLVFNLLAIGGLVVFQPRPPAQDSRGASLLSPLSGALCAGMIALLPSMTRNEVPVAPGVKLLDDTTISLEPAEWVGNPCPLIPLIDTSADLSQGEWELVLYDPDCETCRAMIRKYNAQRPSPQLATCLVDVQGSASTVPPNCPWLVAGRVRGGFRWVCPLPQRVRLNSGRVVKVDSPEHLRGAASSFTIGAIGGLGQ